MFFASSPKPADQQEELWVVSETEPDPNLKGIFETREGKPEKVVS